MMRAICNITGAMVLAWAGAAAGATTWTVDVAGGGDYTTIQAAIDASRHRGTRSQWPRGPIARPSISRARRSACTAPPGPSPPRSTGPGTPHVVQCLNGEGPDTILEGFTITGGNAIDSCGGGLLSDNSSPTVIRCAFIRNIAGFGGGICGDAIVSQCLFSENSAQTGGGTWRVSTVAHSTFLRNTASMGGGVHSAETVAGCTFIDNEEGIFEAGAVADCVFRETSAPP